MARWGSSPIPCFLLISLDIIQRQRVPTPKNVPKDFFGSEIAKVVASALLGMHFPISLCLSHFFYFRKGLVLYLVAEILPSWVGALFNGLGLNSRQIPDRSVLASAIASPKPPAPKNYIFFLFWRRSRRFCSDVKPYTKCQAKYPVIDWPAWKHSQPKNRPNNLPNYRRLPSQMIHTIPVTLSLRIPHRHLRPRGRRWSGSGGTTTRTPSCSSSARSTTSLGSKRPGPSLSPSTPPHRTRARATGEEEILWSPFPHTSRKILLIRIQRFPRTFFCQDTRSATPPYLLWSPSAL